mmetsp:Transcript_2551/g.5155  ORF Transcript_2551/g.5155 Transcript_2551/m.5155 type:complete len:415 (-) Transcript_2551:23-1267(-)
MENEPEVQVRFRIVKKGTIEQWTIGDKTRSLREASCTVSDSFELWELEDMCRVWYHTHPSGLVDRVQFTSYATDFLQLPHGAEEHIERMFLLIDQNNDGVLSFTELSLAMATLARGSLEEKLELGFRLNDLNGDGFISGEEVWKAVHVLWLSGGDDREDAGGANELIKHFLEVADTDGDQRISMDEYKAVALSDSQFLKRMARDSAIVEFTRSPVDHVKQLLDTCDREHTAEGIVSCIKDITHVTRQSRGELLGAETLEGYDMGEVRRCFMSSLANIGSGCIDLALRDMLALIHPPDDMDAMERVFQAFSEAMVLADPKLAKGSVSAVYAGTLAVIRLNVSVHGSGDAEKMSRQDFVSEVRGAFHCDELSTDMLDAMYKRVAKEEIVMGMASVADAVLAELIAQATLSGDRRML